MITCYVGVCDIGQAFFTFYDYYSHASIEHLSIKAEFSQSRTFSGLETRAVLDLSGILWQRRTDTAQG